MNKLPPRMWIFTPAGNICVPDFLEPYLPPGQCELRAVFQYMHTAGVPSEKWNEWRRIINVTKVSEIKSLYNLFTLWMLILRWQYASKVEPTPTCELGTMILPYARDYLNYVGLTPEDSAIVSQSLTSTP